MDALGDKRVSYMTDKMFWGVMATSWIAFMVMALIIPLTI